MELNNTAYVILGALHERPRSGYDIKAFADTTTRHFWATSYSQLYPELARLLEAGLIDAESQPTGGRKRTVYRLSDVGEEALADWVTDTGFKDTEIKDDMMVRLFFSDVVDAKKRSEIARNMGDRHRTLADKLRRYEEGRPEELEENPMHDVVLKIGIGIHDYAAKALEEVARQLEASAGKVAV